MGVTDLVRKILGKEPGQIRFELTPDSEGINFFLPRERFLACESGEGSGLLLHQYVCLQMLEEQNCATRIANGFNLSAEHAVQLESDAALLLGLPPHFPGKYLARVHGQTGQSAFSVQLIPVLPTGEEISNFRVRGPILQLSEQEQFLLTPGEWVAFSALVKHQNFSPEQKTEHQNLQLIGQLQNAQKMGAPLDLSHFNHLKICQPEKVGVTAVQHPDGSLHLIPSYGTGADPLDINGRIGQLNGVERLGTLRVRDQIIVIDEKRLEATIEILTNRRIPKNQVKAFLKSPSAFLNAALIDLDTGFSLRVQGATRFQFMPFGETDASGIDWFTESPTGRENSLREVIGSHEDLSAFKEVVFAAREQGAEAVIFNGKSIDISDPELLNRQIESIEKKLAKGDLSPLCDQAEVEMEGTEERSTVLLADIGHLGQELLSKASRNQFDKDIDFSKYRRQPYPHQEEGIGWLLDLANIAFNEDPKEPHRLQGALLADDMGLGKTYMSLVGLGEIAEMARNNSISPKPVLIVAPLSLLENWEEELDKTFFQHPFSDVVVLQGGRDLKRFRISGAPPETKQIWKDEEILPADSIRYALKVGQTYGPERLDMPSRLVLATYQTLRDYQFSLCRVDWSIVIFDEAQNIKNPNTLQSRAAKGLKSTFKLLATGTPVENSLADFWCLMDTAQPGLLGTWPQFREKYIKPIQQASTESVDEVRMETGRRLRQDVDRFMLRRLKEDNLKGLPRKRIYSGVNRNIRDGWEFRQKLFSEMRGEQRVRYDDVILSYQGQREEEKKKGLALSALMQLREVSLHPYLNEEQRLVSSSAKEASEKMGLSAKLESALGILNEIRDKNEKVIVFAMTKKLQRLLKIWWEQIFRISIPIINGETQAVSTKADILTRKGIIEKFEATPGFGILIMSPIAAGVGLTVVGANHVIHLERHWNPAKEAQATDRVYRIGQKKDVHIYLPTLHHPEHLSFDVNLDRLLQRKMDLKDAVVSPQIVSPEDMIQSVFG